MGKGRKLFRKFIAAFMVLQMLFSVLPWQGMKVRAFDQSQYKVDSVTVYKVFNPEQRVLLIEGEYLKDATVAIRTSLGYQVLTNRSINSDGILQFNVEKGQLGEAIRIENTVININEGQMPTLTGVIDKSVEVGTDDLIMEGTNLNNVNSSTKDSGISARFEHEGSATYMPPASFTSPSSGTVATPSGPLGLQNIIFQKTGKETGIRFNDKYPNAEVKVEVIYTYLDQFRLIQKIQIPSLEMHPNRGKKGDTVFFEALTNTGLSDYDVFFLKEIDGTTPYSTALRGINKTFKQNVDGKDVLTVDIPNSTELQVGSYYVVLTNKTGTNPQAEVNRELILSEKFSIIDATKQTKIISAEPSSGPDTGSKTTISGQFFITMNVDEFTPGTGSTVSVESPVNDPDDKELKVTYGPGKYNDIDISGVERRIRVYVGNRATYLPALSDPSKYDVQYSSNLDRLVVQTPQINDAETNPVKDVVVETETIFTKAASAGGGTITIKERAELKGGYTFIPSKVTPTIDDATPNILQVTPTGTLGQYGIPEDRMVAIHGKNLMITKFVNSSGTPVVRYPIIEFGTELVLDKNTDSTLDVRVFDASGKELDGTTGNELGTKILVTIPKGKTVTKLGKANLGVVNPVRNSTDLGLAAYKYDYIEFVYPDTNKNPVITSVNPSTVTIDGGETITIEGSNFASGVKVFIDGEEVKNITRQGDGKKITFVCPKGREGETQLQVMNPEGGMATWAFTFVKTYTNPKITDFSPKSGKTGTLVVVTGDNFLKPDPTATESNILKLVGSRILLENIEVNEYNIDPNTKKITPRDYKSPAGELILSPNTAEGKVSIADYYRSVLFKDETNGHFYTLDVDVRGRIILSDGAGKDYVIEYDGGSLKANEVGGTVLNLVVDDTSDTHTTLLKIGTGIELRMKTLYKVDSVGGVERITGNRVKVIDRNTIHFYVPVLEADGYYDVTVINPDTKKDSKVDRQGFYYYKQPQSQPAIDSIVPNEGSTEGGYTITLYGKEFEDNGSVKTKVFINGVEVPAADTSVAVDGKTIIVKVPKYPGDLLQDKGTSRLTVPVVVVNPSDGGSYSLEKGFTYVIPGSHPQITKVVPAKGSASGGDIVEITGMDFRYYEPYDDANRNQMYDLGEAFNNLNSSFNNNSTWDDLRNYTSTDEATDLREPKALVGNSQYTRYYSSPILPKVYFGKKEAKIVEYASGYLKVIVPAGTAGASEVFVVNNDAGKSNSLTFTYEASSPKITSILPNQGKKQGRDRIDILGEGFVRSSIDVYNATLDNDKNKFDTYIMPLVRFGSITNRQIAREQENSGRIDNGRTTVRLTGNLTVSYEADTGTEGKHKLNFSIVDNATTYNGTITGFDGSVKFVPLSLLVDGSGNAYGGYEMVKVEISDRRLLIDRGYAPYINNYTMFISANQLSIQTPSYYTVGTVPVTVENPDGGKATGQFEYKNPASNPAIINITKDGQSAAEETYDVTKKRKVLRVNYKGGNILSIIGSDFRENAKIQIGDVVTVDPKKIIYNLPNKMTFETTAVPESAVGKLYRVIVTNEDGGTAMSDELQVPIYIQFTKGESAPVIEKISPDAGPSSGGTRVKVEGKDFRWTMEGYNGNLSVYIGETKLDPANVTFVDYKTLYVIMPPGVPGKVKLRVENPDGEISSPSGEFTYLSTPTIIAVVDPADTSETSRISVISVEGGQTIKLKGSGYQEGARVVFNPVIKKVEDSSATTKDVIYVNGVAYTLESSTSGTEVTYVDSETLTVKTPAGKLDTGGVLVINPDGGASDIYDGLKYGLPELTVPTGVRAELVYDRYIKVNWNSVTGVKEYEIYVVIDDKTLELVGSTKLTSFVYSDLEPRTRYKFIVKAVGDYGPSRPSEESNTVRTGSKVGPTDDDGQVGDSTKTERSGTTAIITIGRSDFASKALTIDLTAGILAGSKEVLISIPAAAAASRSAKDITILGGSFRIKLNPYAFYSTRVEENKGKSDAGIRFKLSSAAAGTDLRSDEGTALSSQLVLEANFFVGKDSSAVDYLSSSIEVAMDFDSSKADMRKLQNIALSRYDGYGSGWKAAAYAISGGTSVVAPVNRLGKYMIVGKRR